MRSEGVCRNLGDTPLWRSREDEHGFCDQAMIDRGTTCLRLLGQQERAKLLPMKLGEGRQPAQVQRSRYPIQQGWSLTSATQSMQAPGGRLVEAPKARPMQAPGLLSPRGVQRTQEPTSAVPTSKMPTSAEPTCKTLSVLLSKNLRLLEGAKLRWLFFFSAVKQCFKNPLLSYGAVPGDVVP